MLKITLVTLISVSVLTTIQASATSHGNENYTANSNQYWWPNQVDLSPLRSHSIESNPYGEDFSYKNAFRSLDLDQVKSDIDAVLTNSQDWWPADYGNYGPFFIRMAWHSAGVYRIYDGRGGASGGQQRFEPLNSWPDNGNLDKARRLLWPVKQKYGAKISWADLMVLAGNVALENMGFKTFGFAGGREDDWEAEQVNWGLETKFLAHDKRFTKDGKLKKPYAAVEKGLIYVNPEGPGGVPDPLLAARDIRIAFGRMAMNDEETVALIAGGHTFGKAHGARKPQDCVGVEPAAENIEKQGFGWSNTCGKGNAEDTITSGLEGAWTISPAQWTHNFFQNLFTYEWVKSKSPAGATQWVPKNADQLKIVPDAHIEGKRHAPIMLTTDLALKKDPIYREISKRFLDNPKAFELAFAKAWFKLTHRDMGPSGRYLGSDVPNEELIWQDPIPQIDYKLVNKSDIKKLKKAIVNSGLLSQQLIRTAWASASTYRATDRRGGANGSRIRLAPQNQWKANNPSELNQTLFELKKIKEGFDKGNKKISIADLIVLGGTVAIEQAASRAGYSVKVPFIPGRADALPSQTDSDSFDVLEPKADGFRNYFDKNNESSPTELLIEKAANLSLTVPEMTVLVGGLRVLDANAYGEKHGVFTNTPGQLNNNFFINLLSMSTRWEKSSKEEGIYNGIDRNSGKIKWTGTPVDLVFGSNAELRAVAEVYGSDDAQEKFVNDFIAAWTKVMQLDRFDI